MNNPFLILLFLIGHICFSQDLVFEDIDEKEVIPFAIVDETPVTKDCNPRWKQDKLKKCVSNSLSMFVAKKFNTDLASDLGLSGRIRVTNSFIINKEGEIVNIVSESPNEKLSEEGVRVINLIPQLAPAKHNGKIVAVEYKLPIIFQIQD